MSEQPANPNLKLIVEELRSKGLKLAVMESCTGGLLAHLITNTPGCGDFFLGGVVAYDTEVKVRMGVEPEVLAECGIVSAETAGQMALAARTLLNADIGIGITGAAGPNPQDGAAVGTVYVGVDGGVTMGCRTAGYLFEEEDPGEVKASAAERALALLAAVLKETT